MKVNELIKILQTMPQNSEVQINYMASEDESVNTCEMGAYITRVYCEFGNVYLSDFDSDND